MLRKEMFKSDIGKKLWKKYFGFLDEDESSSVRRRARTVKGVSTNYIRPTEKENSKNKNNSKKNNKREKADTSAPLFSETESDLIQQINEQFEHLSEEQSESDERKTEQPSKKRTATGFQAPCNLYDLVKYFRNNGLVGEENLVVSVALALVSRNSFGIEGYSGSGKTFITDTLISLVEDKVYRVGLSSQLAIFNDTERVNSKEIIYIPELQKAMKSRNSAVIEAIKDLTEGKDATRLVTSKKGDSVKEHRIKKGRSIIYTLALENSFKADEESSRRFIRLRTDHSTEHIEEIHQAKVRKRYSFEESEENEQVLEFRLKNHLDYCLNLDVKIIDPFAEYFINFIPQTQKSVGYVEHYYSLLDASAKFHHSERVGFAVDGQQYLILDLADHFTVFSAYYKEFVDSLEDFSARNDYESDGSQSESASQNPDWKECFIQGVQIMNSYREGTFCEVTESYGQSSMEEKGKLDEQITEQWLASQIEDGKIYALDYSTGKDVLLVDFTDNSTDELEKESMQETERHDIGAPYLLESMVVEKPVPLLTYKPLNNQEEGCYEQLQ